MPSFSSPQVRPFRYEVTEPDSPLRVWATHAEQGFEFEFSLTEWSFLGPLILNQPEASPSDQTDKVEFWRQVLDYTPDDELEFVKVEGVEHPLPEDLFTDWLSNARYELELWQADRNKWESWLDLGHALSEDLVEPNPWTDEPPTDQQLRQVEFEMAQVLPNRVAMLKRLHGLGLLAPPDGGERQSRLVHLGCPRLAQWRRACVIHHWVSPFVDGMQQGSVLASPVGLDWFYDKPPQQRYLDPLHHLKFALHEHIKREPPKVSSSFVVSMGGRISGAFYYELGPGGIPQLVRGGEPQPGSEGFELYQHALTPGGDRFCELAARATRAGFPRWGGVLAVSTLQDDPEHGQSWLELGVALFRLGVKAQSRACLVQAQSLGYRFSTTGELAAIWDMESSESLAGLPLLKDHLGDWQSEVKALPLEEATAAALCQEVLSKGALHEGLKSLDLPDELFS